MGPVECLFRLGENLSLSIFEANIEGGDNSWDDYGDLITDYAKRYGIELSVIPRCLSNHVGRRNFHINVMPDCSSLLDMSPDAKNYSRLDRDLYRVIWGQICQPTRTVDIEVTTLDKLYADRLIQMPHFLSLDVQGAEYEILEGASKFLQSDLMGVISEVEFRELYEGQKLFMDQYALLKNHHFGLFDLYNCESWYSGPIIDKGALMVAEALFLRDFRYFVEKDKDPAILLTNLSKLAIVAYCFERSSYAFEILEYINNNWRHEWETFIKRNSNKYLRNLEKDYQHLKTHQPQSHKMPTYSEFMAMSPGDLRRYKVSRRLKSFFNSAYNVSLRKIVNRLRLQ
jgi:FkbM family methyltransferase